MELSAQWTSSRTTSSVFVPAQRSSSATNDSKRQPRLSLVTRFRRGLSLPELWEDLGQLRHHRAELGAQRVEILRVELRSIASTNGR